MNEKQTSSPVLRLALTVGAWSLALWLVLSKPPKPESWTQEFSYYWTDFPVSVAAVSIATIVSLTNFEWGRRMLRPLRTPFILLATSTLLTIAGVEVFQRIFDPLGISYFSEMTRYILDRVPDPELKYRHRRSWEATYQGVTLRFNEAGLRDDPIRPKAPLEYRILALGDSQTLGWGVAREYVWPVQLQELLTKRLHRPVRVINAGVASYETRQEYRYLQSDGYTFDPDAVLLMFMDNDLEIDDTPYDPWKKASLKGKSPGQALYVLARKLRVAQLVYEASWLIPLVYAPSYEPQQFGVRYNFNESMREEEGWKASMEYLQAMTKSVESHGLKFAVVHFDWTSFPFSRELNKSVRAAVAPFPVAYVPDWFAGQDVRKYFNSVTDAHPNVAGHRVLAEHITEFILSQHWVSPTGTDNTASAGAAGSARRGE